MLYLNFFVNHFYRFYIFLFNKIKTRRRKYIFLFIISEVIFYFWKIYQLVLIIFLFLFLFQEHFNFFLIENINKILRFYWDLKNFYELIHDLPKSFEKKLIYPFYSLIYSNCFKKSLKYFLKEIFLIQFKVGISFCVCLKYEH